MKLATTASAAIIVLALGIGAASAEDQSGEMANSPVADSATAAGYSFDLIDGVPTIVQMPAEELSEIVGGEPGCGIRRRWFNRFKKPPPTVEPCLPF